MHWPDFTSNKLNSSTIIQPPADRTIVSLYYQNINSLKGKLKEFYLNTLACDFDIIALAETCLDYSVNDREFFDAKFDVIRCDRSQLTSTKTRGGGVLIATKPELSAERIDLFHDNIEGVCVRLKLKHRLCYICCIYIPPSSSLSVYESVCESLEQLVLDNDLIIVGDFNIPEYIKDDVLNPKKQLLIQLAIIGNLTQYNLTLNQNRVVLDLLFSNLPLQVKKCSEPLAKEDSHHPSIVAKFEGKLETKEVKRVTELTYNFKKADFLSMYNLFLNTDWSFLNNIKSVDELVDSFYERIYEVLDYCVSQHSLKSSKYPVWYNRSIIKLIKEKEWYRKQIMKGNDLLLPHFVEIKFKLKEQIRLAYQYYITHVQNNLINEPKQFWSFVNSKKGSVNIPNEMVYNDLILKGGQNIVDGFASYFSSVFLPESLDSVQDKLDAYPSINITDVDISKAAKKLKSKRSAGPDGIPAYLVKGCAEVLLEPLRIIFNLALRNGYYPSKWKLGRVLPIYKSGEKNNLMNYRPIVVLCAFSKLFESVIYEIIYNSVKPVITVSQHGFLPARSTCTNLLNIVQDAKNAIEDNIQLDVIYTDIAKAFDRLDHVILVTKLKRYEICPDIIDLLCSYLYRRQAYINLSGFKSSYFEITSGVPQGSNLGPLLFLIFINDLPDSLYNSVCLLFADDCKIYRRIESFNDCILLQEDLTRVSAWCNDFRVNLNIKKCVVMSFTNKSQNIDYPYAIDNIKLSNVNEYKDLGVLLDKSLSFIEHTRTISNACLKKLGFLIRNTKDFTNVECMKTIYNTLIRSNLEYCQIVWSPFYRSHINLAENIQKKFLRYLLYKETQIYDPFIHYSELLLRYDYCSLELRRAHACIIYIFKLVNNLSDNPKFLSKLPFNVPVRSARNYDLFYVPQYRTNLFLSSPLVRLCILGNLAHSKFDLYCASYSNFINNVKSLSLNEIYVA